LSKLLTKKRTYETFFSVKLDSKTEGTRKQYHYALQDFENYTKVKHNLNLQQMVSEFKASNIDTIIDTLQGWINKSKIETRNKQARARLLNAYLYYRGIKIDPRDMKDLEYENIEAQERKPIPFDAAQAIIANSTPRRKALYLAMLSSGMAIEEALQIVKSDLDTSGKRVKIVIKPSYTKRKSRGRTTFISKEAWKALKPFIKIKGPDDFVFHDKKNPKVTKENEMQCLRRIVDGLMLGKKYDSGTREITSHGFRAYFFTKAVQVHGENYAHKMTGHKGHLMEYDRYDDSKKLEMYLELEPKLLIFEQPIDHNEYSRLQDKIKRLDKELRMNQLAVRALMDKDGRFDVEMAQFALKEKLSDRIKVSEEELEEVIKQAQKSKDEGIKTPKAAEVRKCPTCNQESHDKIGDHYKCLNPDCRSDTFQA